MQWMVPEGGRLYWEPHLEPRGVLKIPHTPGVLTQGHDGEVFPSEFAGDFDFLAQRPAVLGVGVVGSGWRVVAHLDMGLGTAQRQPSL